MQNFEQIRPFREHLSEAEQINYLKGKRTHFIFLFGKQGVGKTAITASLIHYLASESEYGNIEMGGDDTGRRLGARIRYLISTGRFPDRTNVGSLTEIDCRFDPAKSGLEELKFTLLEMSGEDLKLVDVNEYDGKLPDNIDVFFKAEGLSMTFILVTSPDEARGDDQLMVNFLDYLINKSPVYRHSRVLLLMSKWDEVKKKHPNTDLEKFIKENMRQTFRKINRPTNAYRHFSLGEVTEADGQPYISKYDETSPKMVFEWLYRTLTGRDVFGWLERVRRHLDALY
jgi:hypothetical protein